jgi:myo-inositol-1(or 4)-monophosphatase
LDLLEDYLRVCEQAARAGSQVLLQWIGRFEVREKGPSDLVTQADLASQEAIRGILLLEFPKHVLVSEEADRPFDPQHEYSWVVDPLDGTTNYVHQVPHYAVSVALVHHGTPIVGAIIDPVRDECFSCVRGGGAFLNGRPIRTSQVQSLSKALVTASFASKVLPGSAEIDQFVAAVLACQAVRRTGSAALNLCYLAAGRVDAFWALSTYAWDVAAGTLLVEEAGGVVTALDGTRFDLRVPHPVAAANPALHQQFCQLLRGAPHLETR